MKNELNLFSVIEGFDEELYQLEEKYLRKFGVYPVLGEINPDTIPGIKKKLYECMEKGLFYSEDE